MVYKFRMAVIMWFLILERKIAMVVNKMILGVALCLAVAACGGGGGSDGDFSGGTGGAGGPGGVEQYWPPQPKVGSQWSVKTDYTQFDGQTGSDTDPYKITKVNPDNSYVAQFYSDWVYYKAGDQYYGWVNSTEDGRECWQEQSPATIFPLFVGKKLNGTITETCKYGNSGMPNESITSAYSLEVLGVETLTIAGKQLKTVKTSETTTVTQVSSGDIWLQVGDRESQTRWWSPELGIYVKAVTNYTIAKPSSDDDKTVVETVTDFSGF